jgi:Hint domain-containing protein
MSISWNNSNGTYGSTVTLASLTTSSTSSLTISNIPVGATISDGHGNSFTATSGHTSASILGWYHTTSGSNSTYPSLTIVVPNDADFALTATNSSFFNNSASSDVTVAPAAPAITSVTDNVAPVTGPLSNGGYTNDTALSVQVSLANTGARVGDTIRLYNGGNSLTSSYTLKTADIANGYVTLTTNPLSNNTTYNITAVLTDQDNSSEKATSSAFTIHEDTAAPTETVPTTRQTDNWTTSNGEGAGNLILGTAHGNAISINDTGGSTVLTATVSVGSGTFTLGSTTGVTVTNNGSGLVTITGSASAINSALANSVYHTTSHNTQANTTDDTLTISVTDQAGNTSNKSVNIDVICFMPGTMIRTPDGEVAVENLKPDDLVCTTDGRTVRANWIGRQTVSTIFSDKMRVLPIRIKAGALADNVPSRDLLVSPDHALLVEGALIQAGALVNGTSIVREQNVPKIFTYYHVEVDDHSLILAENTPAETFVDNIDRMNFDNWDEYAARYPEGKSVTELPYPRAKSHRQVPVRTRVMLAARAHGIGSESQDAAVA